MLVWALLCCMGSDDDVGLALTERLRATFAKTAEVLAISAELAQAHAERATDPARVELERERARRAEQAARRAAELAAGKPSPAEMGPPGRR